MSERLSSLDGSFGVVEAPPRERTPPASEQTRRRFRSALLAMLGLAIGLAYASVEFVMFTAARDVATISKNPFQISGRGYASAELYLGRALATFAGEAISPTPDFAKARQRFDVYLSHWDIARTRVLAKSGGDDARIVEMDRHHRAVDVVMRRGDLSDRDKLVMVAEELQEATHDMRKLTLEAYHAAVGAFSEFQEKLRAMLLFGGVMLAATIAATLAVGAVVGRQTKRLSASNERLYQLTTELQRANRAKSHFLTNMSHELRTPLNAVIGFSEVMENEMLGPISPRYRGYAADITTSGRHLLELIDDILDLARIEEERFELIREEVCMTEIIATVQRMIAPVAKRKGVELTLRPAGSAPVICDRRALKQILANVIGNAVKYTRSGGRVAVALEVGEEAASVIVADTGVGVPEDEIEHLFEDFSRASNVRRNAAQGAGLGLAISRRLARLHGGDVTFESRLGVGSTVTVTIPRAPRTGENGVGDLDLAPIDRAA